MWYKILFFLLIPSLCFAQIPPTGVRDEGGTEVKPVFTINCVGSNIACTHDGSTMTITESGAGGSGDNVTVNGIGVDTTANFLDGDIDFTLVDGGAGGPDDVTATVECTGCISDADVVDTITLTNLSQVTDADSATQTFTNKGMDADGTGNAITNIGFPEFDTDVSDTMLFTAGAYLDAPEVTITESGGTVSLNIEQSGTGDLRVIFLTGVYVWDTTPIKTVSLNVGTDASPQMNYVYLRGADKILTVSVSAFPIEDIIRVATVLVPSAATVASDGEYKLHAWTDHMASTTCGHLSHMNTWIRSQPATWISGTALTPTITVNGGAEDNVDIAIASGKVLQLHSHDSIAMDTAVASFVRVVNKSGANYTKITDLNAADEDDAGNAIANNKWANLVIWSSVNENSSQFFVNLPSAFHGSANAATVDAEGYSNYNISSDFTGTGFLIARLTLKYTTASSGTWTLVENLDLRGTLPSTFAGGTASTTTEFVDNVFKILDDGDTSKELQFQVSGLTTATTRTLTVPDASGTIVLQDDTATLTNKTINADGTGNSITNIENADIKAAAAIAVNKLAALTVSEIVISDASGFLISGAVATYPSLTEVTYLKGVTSAVQTQMDLKAPLVSPSFTTPALGTPSAGVMTNMTGLPITGLANGTDGELITWSATGVSATVAVGTATHVLTSNGVGVAPTFQAPAGGATKFSWTMRPQQAKLDSTAPMGIDAGNAKWRGTFDDTVTDEAATWETVLFPYQGGTLQGKIFYTLETTSVTKTAAFDLLIECKSDGDSSYTAFAPGTTNSIDSAAQSLTADVLDVLTDTSLNEDSCAEYDTFTVKVFRDVSVDDVPDDIFITKVTIEEL